MRKNKATLYDKVYERSAINFLNRGLLLNIPKYTGLAAILYDTQDESLGLITITGIVTMAFFDAVKNYVSLTSRFYESLHRKQDERENGRSNIIR